MQENAGRHVVFDFDGTIADSAALLIELFNEIARRRGYKPIAREDLVAIQKMSLRERFKKVGVPLYALPSVGLELKRAYGAHVPTLASFPGIPDALAALRGLGYRLAVVSSNSVENIEQFFARNDLAHFDRVYSSGGLFDKHRTIRAHLKHAALTPRDAVYVGDEVRDLEACAKVGVPMVAVTWGYETREALTRHAPAALVSAPAELPSAVARRFAG